MKRIFFDGKAEDILSSKKFLDSSPDVLANLSEYLTDQRNIAEADRDIADFLLKVLNKPERVIKRLSGILSAFANQPTGSRRGSEDLKRLSAFLDKFSDARDAEANRIRHAITRFYELDELPHVDDSTVAQRYRRFIKGYLDALITEADLRIGGESLEQWIGFLPPRVKPSMPADNLSNTLFNSDIDAFRLASRILSMKDEFRRRLCDVDGKPMKYDKLDENKKALVNLFVMTTRIVGEFVNLHGYHPYEAYWYMNGEHADPDLRQVIHDQWGKHGLDGTVRTESWVPKLHPDNYWNADDRGLDDEIVSKKALMQDTMREVISWIRPAQV